MLGENFNNWTGTDAFTGDLCRFFRSPVTKFTRRVRGFKQKFFQCNADLQHKHCAFARGQLQENALESCLRPASQLSPTASLLFLLSAALSRASRQPSPVDHRLPVNSFLGYR